MKRWWCQPTCFHSCSRIWVWGRDHGHSHHSWPSHPATQTIVIVPVLWGGIMYKHLSNATCKKPFLFSFLKVLLPQTNVCFKVWMIKIIISSYLKAFTNCPISKPKQYVFEGWQIVVLTPFIELNISGTETPICLRRNVVKEKDWVGKARKRNPKFLTSQSAEAQ